MAKKLINVRVTLEEEAILTEYATRTERRKTDILRELIRSLRLRDLDLGVKRNVS